jgi:hypothetical protein
MAKSPIIGQPQASTAVELHFGGHVISIFRTTPGATMEPQWLTTLTFCPMRIVIVLGFHLTPPDINCTFSIGN